VKKHIILIVSYLFLFLFLNDKMIATIKKKTDEYYILCVCIYIYIYILNYARIIILVLLAFAYLLMWCLRHLEILNQINVTLHHQISCHFPISINTPNLKLFKLSIFMINFKRITGSKAVCFLFLLFKFEF